MNKSNTVCAVLVTYNRKDLLLECLDGLLKQTIPIDAIYIIDNASTDGTESLLKTNKYISSLPPVDLLEPYESHLTFVIEEPNTASKGVQILESKVEIYYVRMNENTGGAGGFNEGMQRAYSKGYDWLWIMDDDAEPQADGLEKMSKYFNEPNIAALSSSVVLPNGQILISTRGKFDFDNIFPVTQKPIDEQ